MIEVSAIGQPYESQQVELQHSQSSYPMDRSRTCLVYMRMATAKVAKLKPRAAVT